MGTNSHKGVQKSTAKQCFNQGGGGRFCEERQHGGFYITPPLFSLAKSLGKSRVFT